MNTKMSYEEKIERLTELLEEEHGGCEDTTCDISHCMQHGYNLWAIYLFSSSGASSDEFAEIYSSLPEKFLTEADAERDAFVEAVPSVACPHCDAVVYDPEDCDYYCSNCAENALFEVEVNAELPDGVIEGETWSGGFKVVRAKENDGSTIFEVAMKYGKEPSEFTLTNLNESVGSEVPSGSTLKLLTVR